MGVGVGVIVGQRDAKMSSKYPGMKREKCGAYSRRSTFDKKMARGLDKNSEDLTRTPQLVANHRCLAR